MPEQPALVDLPIDSLSPYPGNPRRHDLAAIAASLQANGQYRGVVVRPDGTILAGHGTVQAARELGWNTIRAEIVDVNDDTARRIVLVDNRTNDLAGYDFADLLALLAATPDLAGTGYDPTDLDQLAATLEATGRSWADRPVRALPDNPASQPGQRWQLGPHTLVCGDSTDPRSWTGITQPAGMLMTDPPYGIDYTGGAVGVERARIAGDATGAEAAALLSDVLDTLTPHLAGGAPVYVFTATGPDGVLVQAELVRRRIMHQGLVWCKQQPTLTRSDYQHLHEAIIEGEWPDHAGIAYGWQPGAPHPRVVDRKHRSVLFFDRPTDAATHPTIKPVPLLRHLIAAHQLPAGTLVLEPFGGSGSTLAACHLEGVTCWIVEREPAYCDVILDRWHQATGIPPVELEAAA